MSKRTYKKIAVLCVAVLLGLGVWVYVLVQARGERAQYARESELLAAENRKETYLAAASRDLRQSAEARELLTQLFVEEGKEAEFLEKVEGLGAHAGVSIKVLDFQARGDALRLVLRTEGSFADSRYFLALLEALPFSLSVDTAALMQKDGEEGKVYWEGTYEITLSSYLPKVSVTTEQVAE